MSAVSARRKIMGKWGGFTLIELLVVIAIIALLMSILTPALSMVKLQAKGAVCQSHLHEWSLIWKMFTDEEIRIGNYLKKSTYFPRRGEMVDWHQTILDYYSETLDLKMYVCPAAAKTWAEGGKNPYMAWPMTYTTPAGGISYKISYCINLWLSDETGSGKAGTGQPEFWRTTMVRNAARVPVQMDAQWKDADPLKDDVPPRYPMDFWTAGDHEMQRFCVPRHNDGMYGVFLDWSVQWVGLKQLWRLKWHRTFDVAAPPPPWEPWMERYKEY
jgi:prepilin-type N-terminal cleavage/methylation domain-containing protein